MSAAKEIIPDGTPETAPAPPKGKTVAECEAAVREAEQRLFTGTRQGTPEYDKAREELRKAKDELRQARVERRF